MELNKTDWIGPSGGLLWSLKRNSDCINMRKFCDMMGEASLEVCVALWPRTSFLWGTAPRHWVRGCRFVWRNILFSSLEVSVLWDCEEENVVFFFETWQTDCPVTRCLKPLKPELNPICYLLALLGAHHFLHVSRIRVKLLTFRWLMSYIHGAPILDVSRSHTTTQHSR